MKKKVVWHLISNRWFSAISSYCLQAALSLEQVGFDCVISPLQGSPLEEKSLAAGIKTVAVKSFGLSGVLDFFGAERRINPDYLIVYEGKETLLVRLLLTSAAIIRFRGRDDDVQRSGLMTRVSHSHVDGVITPSKIVTQKLEHFYHVPIETIPYSLGLVCSNVPSQPDRPVIAIVGRLDPIKGHREFLPIFKAILDAWGEGSGRPLLRIIGVESNLRVDDIRARARIVGIGDGDLDFISEYRDDISQLMLQATVGLVSSLGSEIICRVGMEFLALGVPIMVASVGSLSECVYPGHGIQYQELGVNQIKKFIEHSFSEGLDLRKNRAEQFKLRFSHNNMGKTFQVFLDRLDV